MIRTGRERKLYHHRPVRSRHGKAPSSQRATRGRTTAKTRTVPMTLAAQRDVSRVSQLPPAGPAPATPELFVSGLLWAAPSQVLEARRTVCEDDFPEPLRTIVAAAFALATEGHSGPELVLDYMRREGMFTDAIRRRLDALVVAGGTGHALPQLAAAVLANSFRERAEAYGRAIVEAIDNHESEADVWATITTGRARLQTMWETLQAARGFAA